MSTNLPLGSVYTTPDRRKFKNGDFTLKTHQMFSVHTTPKDFENGAQAFTLKRIKCFPSTLHRSNLKLNGGFTLKHIKCFPSTLRRRNLKLNGGFTLKHIKCFPFTLRQRTLKMEVSLWNASNVFRPHYAEGIWKRTFHSENASNVFRPHYADGI